jgi:hypothetical protein
MAVAPTATGPLAKSICIMAESIRRLSNIDPANRKAAKKELKYVAHESMKMLSDDTTSNVVETNPKSGGKTTTWVKIATNKGGISRAALSRQSKQLDVVLQATNLSANTIVKDKALKKLHTKHHSKPLFVFRRNKVLITPNPKDQNKLRQAGGMTDRQYIAFDNMLKDVTGFSVLDQKNTLAKMVDGIMYDFTVHNLAVIVNKQQARRQAFLVDRINDVVLQCIVALYEKGLLLDSSVLTNLDDDNIIVRFGGDKGGTFMKFKFGLTVMNSVNVHSPDAFEICCTLDASDTYYNLSVLFRHYKDELDFYFNILRPPRMLMVLAGVDSKLVLCSVTYNEAEKGLLQKLWDEMEEVDELAPDDDDDSSRSSMGGPFQIRNDTKLEALYSRDGETNMVWGLRFLNVGDRNDPMVIRFKKPVELAAPLSMVNRGMYVVVGGDIEFLHTILGLQGCSATYPCFVCETKLSDLHCRQKDPTVATIRTRTRMADQLEKVETAGRTEKAKKEAAKKNGSKIRPHLIPVETCRILLPPLHMILGIVMKLWFNLIKALQGVDEKNNIQRRLLIAVRDMMMRHVAVMEEEVRHAKETIETLETKKKEAYENLARATVQTMQSEYNHDAYIEAKKIHNEACKAYKDAKETWKQTYNKKYIESVKDVLDDLNIYLKNRQGKYESVLEACISSDPINAKHNPFYSGSFNGNDCQRLMHNFELLFDCLRTEANQAISEEEKESVIDIANRHQVIWDSFNAILPVLRSKEKIETEKIQAILDDINDFWVAYIDNCEGSVTTKLHLLIAHAKWYLLTYGTIGFFTEDALESIHAIVNRLAVTYAALDKTRRGTQILRAMASRKSEMLDRVQVETKKYGEKGKTRKRARQGSKPNLQCSREESEVEKAIDEALSDFFGNDKTLNELTMLHTETENPFEYPSDKALIECELCRSGLNQDVFIPKTLAKLHHLAVHQEVEDKQKSTTKKQK